MPARKPYVAKVALEMTFIEQRYTQNGIQLKVQARGEGSSVPIATGQAVDRAFKDPSVKRKEPAYIRTPIKVLSRWVLDDPPDENAFTGLSSF